MEQYRKLIVTLMFSLVFVSCGGGDDTKPTNTNENVITAVIADGKTFYMSECSGCHSAGNDDTETAFYSSNLSQDHDLIKSDLTEYAPSTIAGINNLMGRFSNLSEQRVADLKAYFKSL